MRQRFASWLLAHRRYIGDALAIAVFVVVCITWVATTVVPVTSFMRGDWPTFFFPHYAYLGERLRALDIPGWNPHQFAGVPFAGDPESGWAYVPAMLLYSLVSPEQATILFIGGHVVLAGVATYVLARLLGVDQFGGFVAGTTYALAWVATASTHMVLWFQVTIWLIVSLIGIEWSLRAATRARRIWGWLLGGFALSQILAAWLGQGAYYAFLVIGCWVAYRAFLGPLAATTLTGRLRSAFANGAGVLVSGLALSAAGLLPRLEAIGRSSLAGAVYTGSSAWADRQTGFALDDLVQEVLGGFTGSLWWYAGAAATALAIMAPIVARRWWPMPFFALLAASSVVLALAEPTPFRALLFATAPFFERLHEHSPDRILILFHPAVALLAGASTSSLLRWKGSRLTLVAISALLMAVAAVSRLWPAFIGLFSPQSTALIVGIGVLVLLTALSRTPTARLTIAIAICALIVWDPAGRIVMQGFVDESHLEHSLPGSLTEVKKPRTSIAKMGDQEPLQRAARDFLYQNGPADFLRMATQAEPGRYAGYDPALLDEQALSDDADSPDLGYRNALRSAHVNRLLVFNWATWFGLEDVQGYNPVQVRRYVEYIDVLNGHRQEYHEADVYPSGLSSPLLDFLNLRYIVVPAVAESVERLPADNQLKSVYEDEAVRVLENPEAYPRAWVVHDARQTSPGEALALLADGSVNPSQTALLEVPPPLLEVPAQGAQGLASIVSQESDRVQLRVVTEAPGLLIMSDVWDPGWVASVNGGSAPVLVANHFMRAVPVPAGEHVVELRFNPPLLRLGILVTLVSLATLCSAAIAASGAERRRAMLQDLGSGSSR